MSKEEPLTTPTLANLGTILSWLLEDRQARRLFLSWYKVKQPNTQKAKEITEETILHQCAGMHGVLALTVERRLAERKGNSHDTKTDS